MKLFTKEKDLILKLTNLALLIWLIASIVLTYTNFISILMPRPVMTYEEYEISNCTYFDRDEIDQTNEEYCQKLYDDYKGYGYDQDYRTKQNFFGFIGSDVIVIATLYLLNKNKKRSKGGKKQ